jgi:L-alanine-DL-glutamate epimerase-like enolase superfamily enzyme
VPNYYIEEVIMKRKEFLEMSGLALAGALAPGRIARSAAAAAGAAGGCRIEAKIYEVKLRHAWTLSRGTWNTRRNVLVRIEKDGVFGLGESAPIARYNESAESGLAFIEKAKPILQKDLWTFHDLWAEVDGLTPGEHAAKAALDMAMLDWVGKKLGIPVYRMLGLNPDRELVTTMTIAIDEVPVMQDKIREAADFSVYKIKVGTADDRKIIEGCRAVTDKPFRVDANEGWKDKEQALEMIRWMAGLGVEMMEQPLPAARLDDTAWIKERSPIPVFADESLMMTSDLPRIAGAFHGVNVKLMKCGGIQEAVRITGMARALGLKLMLGCMVETSIAISAAAAIAPLFDDLDLDGNLLITNDPFRGVRTEKGRLILNDRPGLGVEGTF